MWGTDILFSGFPLLYNYAGWQDNTSLVGMRELIYKLVDNEGELKGAMEVRQRVFVEEQGVAGELEFDKDDREALHMVVKDGRGVIGTARVLFFTDNQAKLERIAILILLDSLTNSYVINYWI